MTTPVKTPDLKFRDNSSEEIENFLLKECKNEIIASKKFMDLYELIDEIGIDPEEFHNQINECIILKLDNTPACRYADQIRRDALMERFTNPDVIKYLFDKLYDKVKK